MPINGDRKHKKRFNVEAYVFIALSLVSFSMLLFSTRSFVIDFRDMGLSLFSGIRGSIYGISSLVSRTVLSVQELATLRREYAELTDRMTRYEQMERTAAEIRQENNRLREQLGFAETLRFRHIPAQIIGRDPDNLFSALVINKGKRDGLANNMPLIAYQNGIQVLVGKVVQAGQFESLVLPVYDLSFYASARLSDSRYEGLVEGQGNPETPLLMRSIPKRAREEINHGDLIVTSGIGGVYPPGITIGRVSTILYQEYETSMSVEMEPSIDFSRLEYVFVIDVETNPEEKEREGLDG
ncbi:rod shape-determining protein MreC [Treponema primitia ZAS-2]|uniref:Cell shape-determining protein MreC n=1 Tax=Treponema primitia (strain ATCC BAA-887 / DSM 12427 / ZAS-2) TaxID=545694 RepID=F5YHY0_TREPZ|nr:rod shape-determining protein MreC [Treponema primitia]AEF84290.1 rod shape-determining protein MreC [Treponema primitia ZAS-2]